MRGNGYNCKLPQLNKLKQLYYDSHFSTGMLAQIFNVTPAAIRNTLNRHGCSLRTCKEARKGTQSNRGYRYSEEHNRRMSVLHKALGHHWPSRKGVTLTKEHKEKISVALRGERAPHWAGGKSFEPYPPIWNRRFRRLVRERDKYECQLCTQYGDRVHHIDHNKLNCAQSNLATLCTRCHGKVHLIDAGWETYLAWKMETKEYEQK